MKKIKSFASFAAVLAVLVFSMAAEAGVIKIKNNTGVEIQELFISDSGTSDWEEDVLGSDTLPQGGTLNLTVNGSYSKFDLRITDGEDALDFFGLDGKASSITLNNDGTASYQ